MERTRKRRKEKSLRASNELKKSKPINLFVKAFSAPSAADTDEDYVCETEPTTTGNGGDGPTGETRLDSSWRDGDCSTGGAALEDQSTKFMKYENPEENEAKPDLLTNRKGKPRGARRKKSVKKEKTVRKASKMIKQAPIKQFKFYTCTCGKGYTSCSHLRRHQKMSGGDVGTGQHYGEPGKPYACLCGKSYPVISQLYRHQKTCRAASEAHLDAGDIPVKPYVCACGRRYSSSSHLYRHQKTHLDETDENKKRAEAYICDCGKTFRNRARLSRHQKTHIKQKVRIEEDRLVWEEDRPVSEEVRPVSEEVRPVSEEVRPVSEEVRPVSEEVRPVSEEVRPVSEEVRPVSEEVRLVSEVKETEALERIKPYVCMCGLSYTCSSHLYRHQRTHHKELFCTSSRFRSIDRKMEKPYKCDCGKSYTSCSHLFRHQKTHEIVQLVVDGPDYDNDVHNEDFAEKPFQCECGKTFILWFSLMVHKRIHCKAKPETSSEQDCP